jgi:hypothetical protein
LGRPPASQLAWAGKGGTSRQRGGVVARAHHGLCEALLQGHPADVEAVPQQLLQRAADVARTAHHRRQQRLGRLPRVVGLPEQQLHHGGHVPRDLRLGQRAAGLADPPAARRGAVALLAAPATALLLLLPRGRLLLLL